MMQLHKNHCTPKRSTRRTTRAQEKQQAHGQDIAPMQEHMVQEVQKLRNEVQNMRNKLAQKDADYKHTSRLVDF